MRRKILKKFFIDGRGPPLFDDVKFDFEKMSLIFELIFEMAGFAMEIWTSALFIQRFRVGKLAN